MGRVLVIENQPGYCQELCTMVSAFGHRGIGVHTIADALPLLEREYFEIVLLDQDLPDGNGVHCVGDLIEASNSADVVVLAAKGDPILVEQALSLGAKEYLLKPVGEDTLGFIIDHSMRRKRVCNSKAVIVDNIRESIIGNSPALLASLDKLVLAAGGNGNVLLTGETGTGKELFARALHKASSRSKERFIVVDCTNLPDGLAESLLYGHEKGAFTGAFERRDGLFKLADKGTIFLDEIGDINPTIQKTLLRVIQEKTFRPLSSRAEVQSDFRLVAATNKNLPQMVQDGTFRKDLYYRLQSVVIDLPPLRKRNGDTEQLVRHYVKKVTTENDLQQKMLSNEFIDAMCSYQWPGNVRELVNSLYEALHMASYDDVLNCCHLPVKIKMNHIKRKIIEEEPFSASDCSERSVKSAIQGSDFPKLKVVRKEIVNEVEFNYMKNLVQKSQASTKKACLMSGLSRTRLYELLNKHNLSFKHVH